MHRARQPPHQRGDQRGERDDRRRRRSRWWAGPARDKPNRPLMKRMCWRQAEDDDGQAEMEDVAVDQGEQRCADIGLRPATDGGRSRRRRRRALEGAPCRATDLLARQGSSSSDRSRQSTPKTKTAKANSSAGPRAKSSRVMIWPPSIWPALLRRARQQRARRADGRARRGGAPPMIARLVSVLARKRRVEAALVPEIRLRAAEAAMPRLDREGDAAVPFQRGAGVVGDRALAADLVEAPALARALVVEALGEQAPVVEGAAVAAVVDGVAEEGLRPARGDRVPAACRR